MNAELAVVDILVNDSGYNAIVGGSAGAARIYYDEIDQTSQFPNAMVTNESINPNDTKQNSNFDGDLIQVFHSASTKAESVQMASLARTALTAVRNATRNGITVNEIRLIDGDSFTEKITNKKIYTTEQIYRVLINN